MTQCAFCCKLEEYKMKTLITSNTISEKKTEKPFDKVKGNLFSENFKSIKTGKWKKQ